MLQTGTYFEKIVEITIRFNHVEENQDGIQFLCDGGAHEIH